MEITAIKATQPDRSVRPKLYLCHALKIIKKHVQATSHTKAKKQLQFISKGCNEVYNYFLKKRIKTDSKNQPQPTSKQQQKELTQLKKQKKYRRLNKIPA